MAVVEFKSKHTSHASFFPLYGGITFVNIPLATARHLEWEGAMTKQLDNRWVKNGAVFAIYNIQGTYLLRLFPVFFP